MRLLEQQKSTVGITIGQKTDEYAKKLAAVAGEYAAIRGLQNLGSTRKEKSDD